MVAAASAAACLTGWNCCNCLMDWKMSDDEASDPTGSFTTLELQNPLHDVPELHNIHRSPDLEALKLWKGRSGNEQESKWPADGRLPCMMGSLLLLHCMMGREGGDASIETSLPFTRRWSKKSTLSHYKKRREYKLLHLWALHYALYGENIILIGLSWFFAVVRWKLLTLHVGWAGCLFLKVLLPDILIYGTRKWGRRRISRNSRQNKKIEKKIT